jgi:O-antigen ligase
MAMISPTPLRSHSVWGALRHPEPSARVLTWIDAGKTFLAHPFLGRGLDMPAAHVLYPTASGVVKTMTDAQNTWLSIMAQAGLPGLLAFAAVMFSLTRRFRWFSPRSDPVRAALELALLGGVVYQLLTESFENTRHVWILMGLVSGVQGMEDEPAHHGVRIR